MFSCRLFFPYDSAGEQPRDKYRKWLEEEVAYLITQKEKEVFLKLISDREKDLFIDAFWKQRDPTPGTDQNEFKDEHYQRIQYANQWYGRGTTTPGWKNGSGPDLYHSRKTRQRRELRTDGGDRSRGSLVSTRASREKGSPRASMSSSSRKTTSAISSSTVPCATGRRKLIESYSDNPANAYSALRKHGPDAGRHLPFAHPRGAPVALRQTLPDVRSPPAVHREPIPRKRSTTDTRRTS